MSTHNLCFVAKIRKIGIPLYPSFAILKWGLRGYILHGHVFLMYKVQMDIGRHTHWGNDIETIHSLITTECITNTHTYSQIITARSKQTIENMKDNEQKKNAISLQSFVTGIKPLP